MNSNHTATVQALQSPCDERKIEVLMDSDAGVDDVILRYSTWTDGLGWCTQKTIQLDHEHLDDLYRALTVARHRLRRHQAEAGEIREPAKVIQLPMLG